MTRNSEIYVTSEVPTYCVTSENENPTEILTNLERCQGSVQSAFESSRPLFKLFENPLVKLRSPDTFLPIATRRAEAIPVRARSRARASKPQSRDLASIVVA